MKGKKSWRETEKQESKWKVFHNITTIVMASNLGASDQVKRITTSSITRTKMISWKKD